MLTVEQFAKVFDLAVLRQDTREAAIREGARTARRYGMAAYYTCPCWTRTVAGELAGSGVRVGVALSFPYGTLTSAMKLAEIDDALANGGTSLDMVVNIGALKDGDHALVRREIQGLVDKSRGRAVTKVILEVGLLTEEEIAAGSRICCEAGVDFIKTSTGSDALPDVGHLEVIKRNLSGNTRIKLSGVPRQFTLAACLWMLDLGVESIGTRSAAGIIDQYRDRLKQGGNIVASPL